MCEFWVVCVLCHPHIFSCVAKNNKVGVMQEEQEAYDKVRSTLVTDHVTEKRGGVAFGLTFISEEAPKMPPRRLMELKKEDSQKWRENQELILARKQLQAQLNREDARIKKQIETAHKELARLEKYANVKTD
ncbi:uncharacterized protein LOC111131286 isoform X1 [Crassostrea virginica]